MFWVRRERLDAADPQKTQLSWQLQWLLHPLDPHHPIRPSVLDACPTADKGCKTSHRIAERVSDVPLTSGMTGATTTTDLPRDLSGENP